MRTFHPGVRDSRPRPPMPPLKRLRGGGGMRHDSLNLTLALMSRYNSPLPLTMSPQQGLRNPIHRPAFADETARAASLCPPTPSRPGDGPRQCFVAVRNEPVERLVGAAFWRVLLETDHRSSVEFEWSTLAGSATNEDEFVESLVTQVLRQCPPHRHRVAPACAARCRRWTGTPCRAWRWRR